MLRDICRSVIRAGFSRTLIVNGHGGNMTALNALTTELTAGPATLIAFAGYFGAGRESVRDTADIAVRAPWAKQGLGRAPLPSWPAPVARTPAAYTGRCTPLHRHHPDR